MIKRIKRVRSDRKAKSKSKSMTLGPVRRFRLFGQPQVLEGEDVAAYEELLARICAAIKPADIIDEMFIADVMSSEWVELARRVAETQIDLRRVRYARQKLLSDALGDRYYDSRENALRKLRFISSLARPNAPDTPLPVLERCLTSTPKGPEKFAIILLQEARRLLAMDRYERSALARRKAAIQVFDGAKATWLQCEEDLILGCSSRRTKPNSRVKSN
jgi:hypothetical protein